MQPQALYDLSPALRLMAMGVVLALAPLAWVWLRNRQAAPQRRLRALTVLTLFLTFDLVLFGAFTRLTDSGLGCPDWPGCYGNASPLGARHEIAQAQAAQPTGPVTHTKAWIEMLHRYLATGVGVLILTLALASWSARRRAADLPFSLWWPFLTLAWVCAQGAFGALTVTMKLFPAIVTLHLLGGIALLALLCVQAVRYGQAEAGRAAAAPALAPGLRAGLWLCLGLVALQIALGGWVSTNYAVLACNQFPTCQGSWWPPMDFVQGFEFWRPLGQLKDGNHISFEALTAIHYVHRMVAGVVFAALGLLVWRLRRHGVLRVQGRWLLGLALWQLGSGVGNVVLGWPLLAAVAHTGGAAAMVVVLTWALSASRPAARALGLASVAPPRSVREAMP